FYRDRLFVSTFRRRSGAARLRPEGASAARTQIRMAPNLYKAVQSVSTPKVLLVNDDAGSLLALASLLTQQDRGFEVITARSGEEALRQVLKHDFAVILLDVSMPGMDG